mmetsp:Transcript_3312/g.6227  ORF Transcript_3312/g.6227 Transcript_3312/m.6227 type:complete len:265 (+) Transcript_3312:116-910(+)
MNSEHRSPDILDPSHPYVTTKHGVISLMTLSLQYLSIMILLGTLLIVHCMLPIWVGMLIRICIISSIWICIVRVMRSGRGMIVVLLMGIGMIRRMRCRSGSCCLLRIPRDAVVGHNRRRRLCSNALGGILLHLLIEALLVFLCHLLILLLVCDGESTPALTKNDTHVNKLDSRVLLHDLGAHVECEEDEGSTGTLGLFGILVLLHVFFVEAAVLHEVSSGVVSRRRDIGCHLGLIASLVLGGMSFPTVLLFETEALIHVGGILG